MTFQNHAAGSTQIPCCGLQVPFTQKCTPQSAFVLQAFGTQTPVAPHA